ncbi:MAG: hypothetical protein K2O66_00035, partial [Bacteroidales bacterium]|nr:hypothetical protein [Bacteroidales bacterium]
MKKIISTLILGLFVYCGMSQTSKLYVFSPWYYGCDLFKQELPADMYKSNGTVNYQSGLPPKYYTYIELEEGDIAIVNGRKFKVEANKTYYFDLL